eukprot:scaffold59567_cov18-Tisochrysis_lutea.AAC.1
MSTTNTHECIATCAPPLWPGPWHPAACPPAASLSAPKTHWQPPVPLPAWSCWPGAPLPGRASRPQWAPCRGAGLQ